MGAADRAVGRRAHYAEFYGLKPLPDGGRLAVVYGNCQAESLRLSLSGSGLDTVRVPPVHELQAADLPYLRRVLEKATALVTQPVRDDYRKLPLGTDQVTRLVGPNARIVRVPPIRFAGLYPAHAIIRPPSDRSRVPPVVAYHDLRLLAIVAGLKAPGSALTLRPRAVRTIAELSLGQLRAREQAHRTLVVSDLFTAPSFAQMRTLNHPGNAIWTLVAERVRRRLGLAEGRPVVRPLLDAVHAPRDAAVIQTFGLADEPRCYWRVDGRRVETETVHAAHLNWYRAHPDAVTEGVRRHQQTLRLLLAA